MTYNSEKKHPWEDGGDQVAIQKLVPPEARGHPFEVRFYSPGPGYGHIKFNHSGIQLQVSSPTKRGGTHSILSPDMDGDFDVDLGDLGCLLGALVTSALGKLVSSISRSIWRRARQDEFGIIWQEELKNDRIEAIRIKGRMLTIVHNQRGRRKFTIRAAREDGERLYQEMSFHYPKALKTQAKNR